MIPINLPEVEQFANRHALSQRPLERWVSILRCAQWKRFSDVRATFGSTDKVGAFYVFNIGGGKYRLIATINFLSESVRIERVLTHEEYERLDLGKLRSR